MSNESISLRDWFRLGLRGPQHRVAATGVRDLTNGNADDARSSIRKHILDVVVPEGDAPLRVIGNVSELLPDTSGNIVGCGGGI